ncbi:hypothetical protein [Paraliomyxa miuraensis]|uniref:hypothetical protein n=1 Tax=Paraliomyxa miuraensis TaxID=376150 RepID=UPI002254A6CF|nr:hypothetical protein [Paraliomyxa miuraensis]MCX4240482.1 hypothetical protein [Paraliomyxa miuraensis]
MESSDTIELLPIPVSPRRAASQALTFRAWIATFGGVEAATQAAVNAILGASLDDPPSEVRRLWLLYQRVYTRQELEGLVTGTFAARGLVR